MVKLLQGDCLELMKDIPDGSVDMVLCDLPYGTTGSKWDSVVDSKKLWEEYRRTVSDKGVIVLFGTEPFATCMRYDALDLYKYDWIWRKTTVTGFPHARNMPLRDYENLMVFSKAPVGHLSKLGNKRMPYNPQGLKECHQVDKSHKTSLIMHSGTFANTKETHYVRTETGFPRMVLDFKKDPKDSKYHLNAKPVPLLEYLIRTYTTEGDTVLDNCMGSGSTGVACVNTGRNFIGMELDEGYYKVAEKRIFLTECSVKPNNMDGDT